MSAANGYPSPLTEPKAHSKTDKRTTRHGKARAMTLSLAAKVKFIEYAGLADYVAKHRRAARLVAALHSRTDLHTIQRSLFVKAAKECGIVLIENGRKLTPEKESELGVLEMLDDRRYTTALKTGQKPAFVASSRRRL